MFNWSNTRFEKNIFFLFFTIIAFLPFNLKINGLTEIIFLTLLSLIILMIVFKNKKINRSQLTHLGSILYLMFFASIVISALYGLLLKSTSVVEMLIGVTPFLFLGMYWILLFYIKSIDDLKNLCTLIIVSGSVVSTKILSIFILNSIRGEYLSRVTFSYPKSTTPLTMVAAVLCIYFVLSSKNNKTIKLFFFLFIMNTFSVFVTFTRSMILTLGISLTIYLIMFIKSKFKIKKNVVKRQLFKLSAVLVTMFIIFNEKITSVFSLFFIRFNSLSSGLTVDPNSVARLSEVAISFENFIKRPIFGHGVGYLFQPGISGNLHGYTHNIFSYLIVTSGVIGTFIYVLMIVYLYYDHLRLVKCTRGVRTEFSHLLITTFVCLNILFIYAQFFAVFRTLEYNILFASIVMMYTKIKGLLKQTNSVEI